MADPLLPISSSKQRYSFHIDRYRKMIEVDPTDVKSQDMLDYYTAFEVRDKINATDVAWQQDNLEYDLRSTAWICDKARTSTSYAQNLYAALCNRDFQRLDVIPILTDKRWSCSWRYAGGILAHMREYGDYMEWYCSGIQSAVTDAEIENFTEKEHANYVESSRFVCEGVVTDEIREDLRTLKWHVLPETD